MKNLVFWSTYYFPNCEKTNMEKLFDLATEEQLKYSSLFVQNEQLIELLQKNNIEIPSGLFTCKS